MFKNVKFCQESPKCPRFQISPKFRSEISDLVLPKDYKLTLKFLPKLSLFKKGSFKKCAIE